MGKVVLEHQVLDSKIATAAALFNEWVKWCQQQNIRPQTIAAIPKLFEVPPEEYKGNSEKPNN